MTRRPFRAMLMLAAALALPACSRIEGAVKGVAARASGPIDKPKLDAAIDKSMGGPDTCLILADTKSGSEAYRYGTNGTCAHELPPCATFDIAAALTALDDKAATVDGVVKWDGKPQAIKAWEHDMALKEAFKGSVPWFFQKLARDLGPDDTKVLQILQYGNYKAVVGNGGANLGPVDRFWMGPAQGGQLAISTRDQARFLQRLYAGKLSMSADAQAQVAALLVDEIRSGATISGKYASCASNADGSRQVGWYVGRLQGPKGDYVFAASIEGDGALPGLEVQTRLKDAFAQAGLWPAMG